MEAFVYCWTDKKTNKLYVGFHKGILNDGYICSSKLMKAEYKQRPQDFSRTIVAHGTVNDCAILEHRILKAVDAGRSEQFYNQTNGNLEFCNRGPMSEEVKLKISKGNTGKKRSEEVRKKNAKARLGKKLTKEHAEALHEGGRKWVRTDEYKDHLRQVNLGRKLTEEDKQKISESKKRLSLEKLAVIGSTAGNISAAKRKSSGYYQSDEWKLVHQKAIDTRRRNKALKEA